MSAPRIVFAGSVNTSRTTLETIVANQSNLVGVLELAPSASRRVSGFAPLADLAEQAGVPSVPFEKINDQQVVSAVENWQPDLLFVVGLSQLVGQQLLALPKLGCVGFHPTLLPEGRGRAPIAWLALGQARGAATFFVMDAGADSGPILVQEPFDVSPDHYAFDIEQSVNNAIRQALNRWLPELNAGHWNPQPQDHSRATYLGKRSPADGLIRWSETASDIAQLVRAASRPFPGAYTYAGNTKITIWRASVIDKPIIYGIAGRVLEIDAQQNLVLQTGDGALRIEEYEVATDSSVPDATPTVLRVGTQLGYSVDDELYRLRRRVARLESQVENLVQAIESPKSTT